MSPAIKAYKVQMAETRVANARAKYAAENSWSAQEELTAAKLALQSIKHPHRMERARIAYNRALDEYRTAYSEEAHCRLTMAIDRLRKAERGDL